MGPARLGRRVMSSPGMLRDLRFDDPGRRGFRFGHAADCRRSPGWSRRTASPRSPPLGHAWATLPAFWYALPGRLARRLLLRLATRVDTVLGSRARQGIPARPAAGLSSGRRHPTAPSPGPAGARTVKRRRAATPRGDRPSSCSLTGCTDRSRSPPAERPGRSRCRTASSRCRRSRRPSTSRPWPPRSARPGCCGSGTGPYRPG